MIAKMRNGGEACTAANRFYVHDVGRRGVRRAARRARWPRCASGPGIDDGRRRSAR